MDYSPTVYQDYDRRRDRFRLPETTNYRPRDRYDDVDRRPYRQYTGAYWYDDRTYSGRYEYTRHNRHADTTYRPRHHHREEKKPRGGVREEGIRRSVTCTAPTPQIVSELEEATEPIFYPELWSTHMTERDYAQLNQWEKEADSLNKKVTSNIVKDTKSRDSVASRKRPLDAETTSSTEPPPKQPRIYINRNHAGFRHLVSNHSRYRNGSY